MSDKTSVIRGPKDVSVKTRNVLRTMLTGTKIMTLPKGARILYFVVSGVASDAGTTAIISLGNTVAATEYIPTYDVKTVATGRGPGIPGTNNASFSSVLTVDTPIFALYAETGTASSGGAWKVSCVYTTGNAINDDTI